METEAAAVKCYGRLFHRRAAAGENALTPMVASQVHEISRDIDEVECSHHLASVSTVCWST